MSKVIIAIHGLDNKPPKQTLGKWWIQAIREGLITHGFPDKIIDFEMVYWADVIYDKPLDENITDKNNPHYLAEKYTPANKIIFPTNNNNLRKKILDFIKAKLDKILLGKDFSVKYAYITDAIIHRYFKDFEDYYSNKLNGKSCTIRKEIRQRVLTILEKHKNDEIFLIAHSMGSVIAYDVLTLLIPDIHIDTFITLGSPLGLPIVKSKIIQEQNLKFNGNPLLPSPPCIKKYWFNFSDLEDSVAINYDLSDDFDTNENGVAIKDIIVNNNYVNGKTRNPHKSFGYLRTLEFATVLSEFIEGKKTTKVQKFFRLFKEVFSHSKKLE